MEEMPGLNDESRDARFDEASARAAGPLICLLVFFY